MTRNRRAHDRFEKKVTEWALSKPAEVVLRVQKALALEALTRIVRRMPVDTGRARGDVQLTIGTPAKSPTGLLDRSGGATVANGVAALGNLPPWHTVYVSSTVPYVLYLEQGSSRQAPRGMYGVTFEELKGLVS